MEGSTVHATLLRRSGLQVTAQRLAVLRAVRELPHSSAAEIEARVRADLGAVSLQAVYDTLAALLERGLIRKIQPAGSAARYEDRIGDNHHHLICRVCGRVVDVDCQLGSAPCLQPADVRGYEIDEAEIVYWGRCPDCAPSAASRKGPRGDGVTPLPGDRGEEPLWRAVPTLVRGAAPASEDARSPSIVDHRAVAALG